MTLTSWCQEVMVITQVPPGGKVNGHIWNMEEKEAAGSQLYGYYSITAWEKPVILKL